MTERKEKRTVGTGKGGSLSRLGVTAYEGKRGRKEKKSRLRTMDVTIVVSRGG